MNKAEIKDKWLKELRSGEHKQGGGTLKSVEADGSFAYCCLGVLQEKVLGEEIKPVTRSEYLDDWLPEGDFEIYKNLCDIILGDFIVEKCARMNDELGMDFKEIADWLEEKWGVE